MWKVPVPVLLLVCGSALLWAPAGGGKIRVRRGAPSPQLLGPGPAGMAGPGVLRLPRRAEGCGEGVPASLEDRGEGEAASA